MSEGAESQRLS